MSSSFRLK